MLWYHFSHKQNIEYICVTLIISVMKVDSKVNVKLLVCSYKSRFCCPQMPSPEQMLFCLHYLWVRCFQQKVTKQILLTHTVFGGILLSGRESGIISLLMTSPPKNSGKHKTKNALFYLDICLFIMKYFPPV